MHEIKKIESENLPAYIEQLNTKTALIKTNPHFLDKDVKIDSRIKKNLATQPAPPALEEKASIFKTLWSWLSYVPDNSSSLIQHKSIEVIKTKPIDFIPSLERPKTIPSDLEHLGFSKPKLRQPKLTHEQMDELIEEMSQKTLEEMVFLVLKLQIESEKENAVVTETCVNKAQECRKYQDKLLIDLKEILAKDQKVTDRLKTAQNVTLAASFFATIFAAAITYGFAAPVGVVLTIAKAAPFVTAAVAALATTATGYSEKCLDDNKARLALLNHMSKMAEFKVGLAQSDLMAKFTGTATSQGALIQALKRLAQMQKLVLQK